MYEDLIELTEQNAEHIKDLQQSTVETQEQMMNLYFDSLREATELTQENIESVYTQLEE